MDPEKKNWRKWVAAWGIWVLFALFFASKSYFSYKAEGNPIPFWKALFPNLIDFNIGFALSPLVIRVAKRLWPGQKKKIWKQALHLPIGIVYCFIYNTLLFFSLRASFLLWHLPSWGEKYTFGSFQFNSFYLMFITYLAVAGITYAMGYYRLYRERELQAAQLEKQLSQSQLQALKMQLHPHFLFNTLHSIMVLIDENVYSAKKMIGLLGDFLRQTLQNTGKQEVTLAEELQFIQKYLEIEQTRFENRLVVKTMISPASLNARVPNLILQPLVENAIRHGIAPYSKPGEITISAQVQDSRLLLEIGDNGPGIPIEKIEDWPSGFGLKNVKERLKQMYGSQQRLELENRPGGGLLARLAIPLNLEPEKQP